MNNRPPIIAIKTSFKRKVKAEKIAILELRPIIEKATSCPASRLPNPRGIGINDDKTENRYARKEYFKSPKRGASITIARIEENKRTVKNIWRSVNRKA